MQPWHGRSPRARACDNHSQSKKECLLPRNLRKRLCRARGHPVPHIPTASWMREATNHHKHTRVRIYPALQAARPTKQTLGYTRSRNRRSAVRPKHNTMTERHRRTLHCQATNHHKHTRVRIYPALQAARPTKQTLGYTRSRNRRSAVRPKHNTMTERHRRTLHCRQRIVRQSSRQVRIRHARD